MKLGFVGLGIMGRPMAMNLLRAGFSLVVCDRISARCEPLGLLGASLADSPKEVAAGADVVIIMVPDTLDVDVALFGENGLWRGLNEGSVVIDMSTISPYATTEFARRLREKGCEMLDAPVSGGEQGAKEGTLAIMVGGKREVFAKCLPLFQAMGKVIVYAGLHGAGQKTKAVNQVVNSLNLLAMVEGIRLARAAGLDLNTTLRVVAGGAASSWMIMNLAPKIVENDFAPGFSIRLQQKDLRLARELILELGQYLPGTELTYSLFTEAVQRGLGDQGNQGLINLWEKRS